ncbi:uncharacterized protein LOC114357106 [Ostrinia furnacalis]|uniref:uncharacterized protein LOC114353563 n=1 Tax=Ostrinia furnacalis TaxID=93504 RepID=UPI00103D9A09|nr:uncharacterized protein LOC114353563 [Ostrinia furnacalis]XP_028166376.1 uncharacterized protein LOC114357106 [Ostrinia furnacalis]
MSLQHTPPNKFASDTNIPTSVCLEDDAFILSVRKRKKQPDSDDTQERLSKQLSEQESKITDCITAAVNSALEREMSKVSTLLTEINANVMKLTTDNISINKTLSETNNRLSEMEKYLNFSSDRQDSFESRLKVIEEKNTSTTGLENQIITLENQMSRLEQQARQCNIEIANLPERRGENLISILENLGDVIKQPIRACDIVAVHRVPHADSGNRFPKNVIAKFTNRTLRDNIISAYRSTKGLDSSKLSMSGTPARIYINEHLTLNNKILFRQCREAAKKEGFKYVWVKHGSILVRKSDTSPVSSIRSIADISKIK